MSLLVWIIFGALAGLITSILASNDAQQRPITNVIVGIMGAFVGGLLVLVIGRSDVNRFNLYGLIMAILGSAALLWIHKTLQQRHPMGNYKGRLIE